MWNIFTKYKKYNIHTQGKTTPYTVGENDVQAWGKSNHSNGLTYGKQHAYTQAATV
jgi:hypothetical protein